MNHKTTIGVYQDLLSRSKNDLFNNSYPDTVDPNTGLRLPILASMAITDLKSDNGLIAPIIRSSYKPTDPFSTAGSSIVLSEFPILACLLNSNHEMLSPEEEAYQFRDTLHNLGALLVSYSGQKVLNRTEASLVFGSPPTKPTLRGIFLDFLGKIF